MSCSAGLRAPANHSMRRSHIYLPFRRVVGLGRCPETSLCHREWWHSAPQAGVSHVPCHLPEWVIYHARHLGRFVPSIPGSGMQHGCQHFLCKMDASLPQEVRGAEEDPQIFTIPTSPLPGIWKGKLVCHFKPVPTSEGQLSSL